MGGGGGAGACVRVRVRASACVRALRMRACLAYACGHVRMPALSCALQRRLTSADLRGDSSRWVEGCGLCVGRGGNRVSCHLAVGTPVAHDARLQPLPEP